MILDEKRVVRQFDGWASILERELSCLLSSAMFRFHQQDYKDIARSHRNNGLSPELWRFMKYLQSVSPESAFERWWGLPCAVSILSLAFNCCLYWVFSSLSGGFICTGLCCCLHWCGDCFWAFWPDLTFVADMAVGIATYYFSSCQWKACSPGISFSCCIHEL